MAELTEDQIAAINQEALMRNPLKTRKGKFLSNPDGTLKDDDSAKSKKKLPPSGEDDVGKGPLVTDEKGKEVVPEIRKKRSQSDTRAKMYGKDK